MQKQKNNLEKKDNMKIIIINAKTTKDIFE